MIVLNPGEKLFLIVNHENFRVYSIKSDSGPFSASRIPLVLTERVGVWQPEKTTLGMSLAATNELLSKTEMKTTVMGHEYIHQNGTEVRGKEIEEVATQAAKAIKTLVPFDCYLDFIDQKPVVVVLLRPRAFEGR